MEGNNTNIGGQDIRQQSAPNESQASPASLSQTPSPTLQLSCTANVDKKIRYWRKFSLILGLIAFFGYIFAVIGANVLARKMQFGWIIFMVFSMAWRDLVLVLFLLSLISLIRIIVLSKRRKKHVFRNYAMVVIGLVLVFSPHALSDALALLRISWNENNSVSVTLKSKDPYYLSGDSSWGAWAKCAEGQKRLMI